MRTEIPDGLSSHIKAGIYDEGSAGFCEWNGSGGSLPATGSSFSHSFDDDNWFGWGNPHRMQRDLLEERLTHSVIGAFYEVYNTLGFGFLESLYITALERELLARGHEVRRKAAVLVMYKGELLGRQRLDMIVDNKVVVETKSTYKLDRSAPRQLFNYLKATNLEIGLLLHFGPKPGFFRLISSNKRSNRPDPFHPQNPAEPSS